MNQRSALARFAAVVALVCGFLVLIVVIATSVGDGEDDRSANGSRGGQVTRSSDGDEDEAPKSYVVQNGDTLTSIANETGVPVSRIEELNPGVDPQILVSGEKLKLR
ncbi:MAG TPA: LysM domain-containing protein [Solirubrobacterales bacterium]|nr:LysM domain-containing protein [Solirubrobacterales bacterium]